MSDAREMWIYRDGRERRSGRRVLAELLGLVDGMARASGKHARRIAVDALVCCGELESALTDAADPAARAVAVETDVLASAALGGACDVRGLSARLCTLVMPAYVTLSAAEGFAYYGLHPEAYARAACNLRVPGGTGVLVVGVRSIGTTLSAIARAALLARGEPSTRLTVRPSGHPYDRRLELDAGQRLAVERASDQGSSVLIVDEGPGLSGSTFLATAEAVVEAGVPASRLTLVCSHAPSVELLAAPDAVARFRRFRVVVAPSDVRLPPRPGRSLRRRLACARLPERRPGRVAVELHADGATQALLDRRAPGEVRGPRSHRSSRARARVRARRCRARGAATRRRRRVALVCVVRSAALAP